MDLEALGPRRNVTLPGLAATVGEEIASLKAIAGDKAVGLIRREPDPVIEKIVSGWARDFSPDRAVALGFRAESSFDEIIRAHIEDELGGRVPASG
jgi:nucleoside-diphosphate-sugar epimerase